MQQMSFGIVSETHGAYPDPMVVSRALRSVGCSLPEPVVEGVIQFLQAPRDGSESPAVITGLTEAGISYERRSSLSPFRSAAGELAMHDIVLKAEQHPRGQVRLSLGQGPANFYVRVAVERLSEAA